MSPTLAPPAAADRLPADVAVYLRDLDMAAAIAVAYRDRARVLRETETPLAPCRLPAGITIDRARWALNDPVALVRGQHLHTLAKALAAAQTCVDQVAAWYGRSATLALQAVLTGGQISPRALEQATVNRATGNGPAGDPWEPWLADTVPPLVGPDKLATGQEYLDQPIRDAHRPLARAYQAWSTRDALEHGGSLTDQQATTLHDANQLARALPDLLIAYARRLHEAALRASMPGTAPAAALVAPTA
jgi:hypothetical protein